MDATQRISTMFRKAVRHSRKLRATIDGPTGSGKTYSALLLASGLTTGKIALLDTEHRSAELFADHFDFNVSPLDPPYTTDRYIAIINSAKEYDVLVIDSLSHAWEGQGGVLEMHSNITAASRSGNSYTAWRDVTPKHDELIRTILAFPGHIITTMRSKMEYLMVEGTNGKKAEVRRVGMAPIQRAGVEYEFDLVLDMSADGNFATASKKRMATLFNDGPFRPTRQTGEQIRDWLASGKERIEDNGLSAQDALRADWVAAIESATSLADLATIFPSACDAMKKAGDRDGLTLIVEAKDREKKRLTDLADAENELNNTQGQGQ